jgi:hypothetical protein
MSDPFSGPASKNWAIAIVHGLGTPEPGETRKAVCDGIRQVKSDFAPDEVSGKSNQDAAEFAQQWKFAGGRAKVAEVFWGDLSLVRGSWRDVFWALCINLFGATHLVRRVLQKSSRFVRLLSRVPFYLVRWIVFPVHVLCLLISLPFLLLQWSSAAGGTDYLTSSNQVFLWTVAGCAFAGAAVTVWLLGRRRKRVRPQPWDVAASFTAFAGVSAACATTTASTWFEQCVEVYGGTKQNLGAILLEVVNRTSSFGVGLCKIVVISTPIEESSVQGIGRYIALNEFVTDTTYFLAAGAVLVYLLIAIVNWLFGRRDVAHAMFFVTTICMVLVMIVAILLQPIDWVTRSVQFGAATAANLATPRVQAEAAKYLEAYWYELGFVLWLAVVVVGAAVAIAWRKTKGRRAGGRSGASSGASAEITYARIIVSVIFQSTVITATLVFIVAFIWSSELQILYHGWYTFKVPSKPLGAVFLGLLMVVVLSFRQLRLGLDIAMDVINHFVEHPKHNFPIRRSISQRFHDVLDDLTRDGDRPHLLVIAHSQGTVITVDALMKDIWNKPLVESGEALKDRVSSMTILTFGSPLTHIYQHYFPEDYAPFSTTVLQKLSTDSNVQWLNIYRVDDFVGTVIAGPNDAFPRNIGIKIGKKGGGHFHYWEDDVLGVPDIRAQLPGANKS